MTNTVSKIQEFALPKRENAKRIVYVGFGILLASVSMYVYFVGKIVFDVVGRRTAEASIRTSQSHASQLAAQYLSEMKGLDVAQAENLGLSVSHKTLYAVRTASTNVALANQ